MTFKLKVAYIPEHFSTPLFLAEKQRFYEAKGLDIEFVPVIEGTGRLVKLLNEKEVDIAIGLTEAFVADVSKGNDTYKLIGTYVESPLRWAVSTGYNRKEITKIDDLKSGKIGVSRLGSGSYVMSFVLALENKFPEPFFSGYPVLSNFKNLRDSVNHAIPDKSDAFMWEYFTTKKYYDNKELKMIGDIYTPWPSWVVTARNDILTSNVKEVKDFLSSVSQGIKYFLGHKDEAVKHIYTNLDYSEEDAQEWLKTVEFNEQLGVSELNWKTVVENTVKVLKKAGVLTDDESTIQKRVECGVAKKI